jgi:nitronate monooxygenase
MAWFLKLSGRRPRALRNSTARAWEAAGCRPDDQRPGAGDVIAHFASGEAIVRYEPAPPMTGTTGEPVALGLSDFGDA